MSNETDNNQETNVNIQVENQEENKDNEQVQEVKDDEVKKEQQEEVKETEETRESLISKIKNIIRRKPDDGAGDTNDSAGDDAGKSGGADIPQEFTDAALADGWTAEQITEWASDYTDDELRTYAKDLKPASEDSDKSEQLSKKEVDTQVTEKKDDDKSSDEKDAVIAKLTERLDKLEKGQQENIEQDAQAKLESQISRASKQMDDLSKEFEIFGTAETLPRFPDGRVIPSSPQAKARREVVGLALKLHMEAGESFDNALDISLNAYKGKNLAKDVKRNLVKSLKKNEKRLSAKRSSHESVKTASSGVEVIQEVKRKHGID